MICRILNTDNMLQDILHSWKRRYYDSRKKKWEVLGTQHIYTRLKELQTHEKETGKPTARKVIDAAIGNDSWTRYACSVCGRTPRSGKLLRFYDCADAPFVDICLPCYNGGLKALKGDASAAKD